MYRTVLAIAIFMACFFLVHNLQAQITLPWTEGFENAGPVIQFDTAASTLNGLPGWSYLKSFDGRLRFTVGTGFPHTGSKAATLDASTSLQFSTNDLIVTLDLTQYALSNNINLSFWYQHHGEERQDNDSVWVRGSNTDAWIGLYDLYANRPASPGVYRKVSGLDVDAVLGNAGQTPGATFQLRFGQEDNFPANSLTGSDGITLDDIRLEGSIPTLHDAGVIALIQPNLPSCAGVQPFEVSFINNGQDTLHSVDLHWVINGMAQPTVSLTGLGLPPAGTIDTAILGNFLLVAGTSYSLQIFTSNPNGMPDGDTSNDTLAISVFKTGLPGGNYTINSGMVTGNGNYQTFGEAFAELNDFGICGPVVFDVTAGSGPYLEQVTLLEVAGSSAMNTITFDGGISKEQIWADTSLTGVNHPHVIQLSGADYVVLRNLTISNYSLDTSDPFGTYGIGIHLLNEADFNTIENCVIEVDTTFSTTSSNFIGIQMAGQFWTSFNPSANFTTIQNNHILGGYAGISLTYQAANDYAFGNRILGNTIENVSAYGIRANFQETLEVQGNDISLSTSGTLPFGYGISVGFTDSFKVTENTITNPILYGIFLVEANWAGSGNPSGRSQVINNMISGVYKSGTTFGIYVSNNTAAIDFFHNSVSVTSGIGNPFYTLISSNISGLDIRNNSFANFGTSAGYAAHLGSPMQATHFDYNNYHNDGDSLLLFVGNDLTTTTFSGASGFNLNSIFGDPGYLNSFTNLHANSAQLWEGGDPAVGVLTDIDGDARPGFGSLQVDIGADEFSPPSNEVLLVEFLSPTSGCGLSDTADVGLIFTNLGTDTIFSISLTYVLDQGIAVTETAQVVVPFGDTYRYIFSTKADLSLVATYEFDGWLTLPGDANPNNDSLMGYTVVHRPAISTFPYFQSFDDTTAGWIPDNISTGIMPFPLTENWTNDDKEGPQDWVLRNLPPGSGNGPPGDHTTGMTNFLYVEDSGLENDAVNLISPCFELAGLFSPVFSFWYHSYNLGTQDNSLHVDIITKDSMYKDVIPPIYNDGNSWRKKEVDLFPFRFQSIQIRFRANNNNQAFTHDIAIDDVELRDLQKNDLGVTRLLHPISGLCGDSMMVISVEIENHGADDQFGFPVSVDVNFNQIFLTTLTEVYPDTLRRKQKDTLTFSASINTHAGGKYDLIAYTHLSGDSYSFNDSLYTYGLRFPGIPDLPVVSDTTSCQPDSFLLKTTPVPNTLTYWWDSDVGGNFLTTGDSIQTPFLSNSTSYWVSRSSFLFDTLATAVDANNGEAGCMFDLRAKQLITLDSFEIVVGNHAIHTVEVYHTTQSGSYDGKENNPTLWTLLGTAQIRGNGPGQLTRVRIGGLTLPADTMYGIYITLTTGPHMDYTTLAVKDTLENDELELYRGIGKGANFGLTFSPRGWNGSVYYSTPGCESPRVRVHAVIGQFPVVDLGPDRVVCGDTLLDAQNLGAHYLWQDSTLSQTFRATQSGRFSVVVTDPLTGCHATDTVALTIEDIPQGGFTFQQNQLTVAFTDTSSGLAFRYQWDFGDGQSDTSQNPIHTYATSGTYFPCLSLSNICGTFTICDTLTVIAVGLNTPLPPLPILISPNPTKGKVKIVMKGLEQTSFGSVISIKVLDMKGRNIYSRNIPSSRSHISQELDLSFYPAGMYIVAVRVEDRQFQQKIILH